MMPNLPCAKQGPQYQTPQPNSALKWFLIQALQAHCPQGITASGKTQLCARQGTAQGELDFHTCQLHTKPPTHSKLGVLQGVFS